MSDKDLDDILRPLSDSEVDELMQLYENKYGVLNFHYLLLYNQRKWDRQLEAAGISQDDEAHKAMRKRFYTHRTADFRRNGTYVSLHQDVVQSVSFYTEEPAELFECLEQTERIEWKKGALLTNVDLEFAKRVKEIALRKGAADFVTRECHGLVLANKDAQEVQVPELPSDFQLRRLNDEDAELVHAVWPNKGEGSHSYIRALIKHNRTLGACRSDTGELIAWVFQNDFAGLGMLQVLPKVEQRGLGGLLAASMTKLIARREDVTLSAWIVSSNWRSEALLKRIGYQKTVVNEWIKLHRN